MIAHRPIEPHDRRFVVDAWARSFQNADTAGMISPARWFAVIIPEIERILDARDTETFVAYEPNDKDRLADLYGFIVMDRSAPPPIVYYCYTKSVYRRAGIARGLFDAAGIDPGRLFLYTCTTAVVSRLVFDRKLPHAVWSPHMARFADATPRDLPRRDR